MIDINIIRDEPDRVRQAMRDLYDEEALARIDLILDLDVKRRDLLQKVEELRAEKNAVSKQIGITRDPAERQQKIDKMKKLNGNLDKFEAQLKEIEPQLEEQMHWIPNLPAEGVPLGKTDAENPTVRQEGDIPEFAFEPLPHWELGPMLDIIDFERGAKISGSRFYVLKGIGARLQRALITWMLDVHINDHGYTELYPPYMVRGEMLFGTGNLPKFGENLYRDIEEDFWWIPTAEVPVTNYHRDEILDGETLPRYYVAYTPCFRREKMSAGRDVRGIKRGHQFDKVEMVKIVEGDPEVSERELNSLVESAADIARLLKLPFRVVQMVTGDLSFTAAKKYDIELWAAGSKEWLEVSSCSNFHDFQARRAGIRYRPEGGGKVKYAHTLNGSGLALPRVLIAVLENYQQPDGSVIIPDVLRPYMGGIEVITPPVKQEA
jgi:seryl-tRNA synthetase